MGLFSRGGKGKGPAGADRAQPPDEYGATGAAALAAGNAQAALEAYMNAIDKLHTMYVIGRFQYRTPPAGDYALLEGFVSAAQAVKAERGEAAIARAVEQTANYLGQIADALPTVGAPPSTYLAYLDQLNRL